MPSFAPAAVAPSLIAHNVADRLAQDSWDDFSIAFDEVNASNDERAAFAHFYLEASIIGEDINLPRASELKAVLAAIRA